MWKPDICLYHDDDDGFGAAWAVWKRWGVSVAKLVANYGDPAPDAGIIDGKNVLIVDFSYPRAVIDAMAQTAKSIVIIDHHKSAAEALAPFAVELRPDAVFVAEDVDVMLRDMAELGRPPILAWFDMDHSGAVLAWRFANNHRPVPKMLEFIEDRDLWRQALAFSPEVNALIRSVRRRSADWDDLDEMICKALDKCVIGGGHILRAQRQSLEKMLRDAHRMWIDSHDVPAVNVHGQFASEAANALLRLNPDAPFAAAWFVCGSGAVKVSLRSEDGRADVSEIAKRHGGGGHRNAAGFECSLQQLGGMISIPQTPRHNCSQDYEFRGVHYGLPQDFVRRYEKLLDAHDWRASSRLAIPVRKPIAAGENVSATTVLAAASIETVTVVANVEHHHGRREWRFHVGPASVADKRLLQERYCDWEGGHVYP